MSYLNFGPSLFIIIVFILMFYIDVLVGVMPSFDRSSENVTVVIGNEAVLPCFINNLGDHKVAWVKVANMDILSIGDYKVTNDDRIRLLHGYVSDWSLSIQPVNEEDAGEYICQINTEPQIITKINIEVLLPPKIIEEKSSLIPSKLKEGDSLSLYCHAEGIPIPNVSWYYREKPSVDMVSNRHFKRQETTKNDRAAEGRFVQVGPTLSLKYLTRSNSGVYECIANNSVPPAASRKIKIMVEFTPEVQLEHDTLEYTVGQEARIECKITAYPLTNHYWMKNGLVIDNLINAPDNYPRNSNNYENRRSLYSRKSNEFDFSSSQVTDSKYEILIYDQNTNEHSLISALVIKNLTTTDFGIYECYAVNSHNTSKIEGELIEIRRPTTSKNQKGSRILVFDSSNNEQNQTNHLNKNFITENGRVKSLLNKEYSLTTNLAKFQRKRFNMTLKSKPIVEEDYASDGPFSSFLLSDFGGKFLRGFVPDKYVNAEHDLFTDKAKVSVVKIRTPFNDDSFISVYDPICYDNKIKNYVCVMEIILDCERQFEYKLQKDFFKDVTSFEDIIKIKDLDFKNSNPKEKLPNRVLIVKEFFCFNLVLVPFDLHNCIKEEAISQIKQIKTMTDACGFIDKYGHVHIMRETEGNFRFGRIRSVELLISSNKKTDFQLKAIGTEYIKSINLEDYWSQKDYCPPEEPRNCQCELYTLGKRLKTKRDYENLFFITNIFNKNLFEHRLIWKYFEELLRNKSPNTPLKFNFSSLNLLESASTLRKKNFFSKENWRIEHKEYTKNDKFDLEYYMEEVVFRQIKEIFDHDENLEGNERKERKDRKKRIEHKTKRSCKYFDMLVERNKNLTKLFATNKRFIFLEKSQKLIDYLKFEIQNNQNQEILLIYLCQRIIGELQDFDRLAWVLQHLSGRIKKLKFVFIDYSLHANDIVDTSELRLKYFFDKSIHFELFTDKSLINDIKKKADKQTTIDLSSSNLSGIYNMIELEKNKIKRLDLSKNYLVSIDMYNFCYDSSESWQFVYKIEELILSKNFLTHIEWNTFFYMQALRYLDLSSNFLSNIEKRLFVTSEQNSNITILDISNNNLTDIAIDTFKPLVKLKVLKMNLNLLKKIDERMFEHLIKLEDLDLDRNLISYVSEKAFCRNYSLKKLHLNNNKINHLSNFTFQSLKLLEMLDLSFNMISNLNCEYLFGLKSLKQICLQGNSLISFNRDNFKDLIELRVLLAHSNRISFIENDAFSNLINLKVLTLYGNELSKGFNCENIRKGLKKLKHFYFLHEKTKLKDLIVYERIKKYLIY